MANARLLIADDDVTSLKVLEQLLRKEGYESVPVGSGDEVFASLAAKGLPDLILLDVVLPDMDGIEVCRRLKSNPETAWIPVLLISALRRDDDSIRKGLEAGADGYLTKPVEDIALRAWVRATLRISSLHRELVKRAPSPNLSFEELLRDFAKLSHAVNNPLQALYATVDMLMLSLPEDEECAKLVSEIFEHAERVAKLVAHASLQAKDVLHRSKPPTS